MAHCDLCGNDTKLYKAVVEGSHLHVCTRCVSYGKNLGEAASQTPIKRRARPAAQEQVEIVPVSDAARRIKNLRQQRGMTQADFAKEINERESLVPKWESGSLTPTLTVLRKIERTYNITLTEADAAVDYQPGKRRSASFTLGDFIKIKD